MYHRVKMVALHWHIQSFSVSHTQKINICTHREPQALMLMWFDFNKYPSRLSYQLGACLSFFFLLPSHFKSFWHVNVRIRIGNKWNRCHKNRMIVAVIMWKTIEFSLDRRALTSGTPRLEKWVIKCVRYVWMYSKMLLLLQFNFSKTCKWMKLCGVKYNFVKHFLHPCKIFHRP